MNKILLVALITIFGLTDAALAQDSFSVSVSCIIPAVPGVNAPLIEEKTISKDNSNVAPKEADIQEGNKIESPSVIQEEKEIQLAQGKTAYVIVQTLYSR